MSSKKVGDPCPMRANDKIERTGQEVYGLLNEVWFTRLEQCNGNKPITKAILINVEPIQACTHPKEKVIMWEGGSHSVSSGECECGAKVRASAFEEIK